MRRTMCAEMEPNMDVKGNFSSIEQVAGQYFSQRTKESENRQSAAVPFEEVLKQQWQLKEQRADGSLKFSKHAGERLRQRNITLSEEQMRRLEDGAQKANEKGIKESLVLLDSLAFIVNTKNNTVITAMERSGEADNIYTNIDGAVII